MCGMALFLALGCTPQAASKLARNGCKMHCAVLLWLEWKEGATGMQELQHYLFSLFIYTRTHTIYRVIGTRATDLQHLAGRKPWTEV